MMTIAEDLNFITDKLGPPQGGIVPDGDTIEVFRDKVPLVLLEFWKKFGFGAVLDGYFQFCDPKKYAPLIGQIFAGDLDVDPEKTVAVGFTAFGTILAWNNIYQDITIDLLNQKVNISNFFDEKKYSNDVVIVTSLSELGNIAFNKYDKDGKLLFKRAKAKLGVIQPDEIYGFVPILALGGGRSLDYLHVVKAAPHMSLLAQAGTLRLLDYSATGIKYVRDIGRS